tara:strand:+ start:3969 stop:4130 length:162 start_codon:yes stop_codon:yes gene_type:complete
MTNKTLLEKDHQLEKLEFALAVSINNGDNKKSFQIIEKMKKLESTINSLEHDF